ncbi:MAG: hypothetical protein LDLANPLL_00115 [Turneriella sp.]|nr:hypothetical protein [Turneriella sp.]
MKNFNIRFLCIALSFVSLPLFAAPSVEDSIQKITEFFAKNSGKTVAVMPFQHRDTKATSEVMAIQNRLIEVLVATGNVVVIERDKMEQLLHEHQIDQSGLTDKKRIGSILQADYLLIGSITQKTKTTLDINARLVDVTTSQIMATAHFNAERSEFPESRVARTPSNRFLGEPLVQLAILIDTSSSMDGLIEQTRTQLWKIVNTLAGGSREGKKPRIEVALYEYGNSMLKDKDNYVRRVLPFTTSLDTVSEKLFELKTMGGLEYCGAALNQALNDLEWKNYDDVYRVIFIAGNEAFTQGPVDFRVVLETARQKGIFVNTIFAGSRQEGIATQWLAAARIAEGDFHVIDQNQMVQVMTTPYDEEIRALGYAYNDTVIPLGESGVVAEKRIKMQDRKIADASPQSGASTERAQAKASAQYSEANSWDLTSAASQEETLERIKKDDLPQELKEKSKNEIKAYVSKKQAERKKIQTRIDALAKKRNEYILRASKENRKDNFGRATQISIRAQGKKRGFAF